MVKSLIKSVLYGFLMVIFPIIAGVIIEVNKVTNDSTMNLIQAITFLIASIIGIFIYKRHNKDNPFNFSFKNENTLKKVLYFLPLIVSELLVFTGGINTNYGIIGVLSIILLCIFVGISEEVFFRGIIFNKLETAFSFNASLIISSLIFSLLHLTRLIPNLVEGSQSQTINYTILQLLFAFLFGVLTVYLTYHTKSLVPAIVWHIAHDVIAFTTGDLITTYSTIILAIQVLIIIVYIIYLKKKRALDNK